MDYWIVQEGLPVEQVKKLKSKPTKNELLDIYSLFKQATIGDINIDRPSFTIDYNSLTDWEAWNDKKGMSQAKAESIYCYKLKELTQKYGLE